MSQVATCYRRGVTCDSSWVTCDSSWVTCDCSWVTCDSSLVTCGHLWHRSLNMLRFLLWYIEGVLGCFFPTLLGRSQFDYFGIFYFPKSTFKVVPGETWVNEHTNFHMTLQLQNNQQMDDIQGVFFTGTSILLMWQPCIWKRWTNVVYFSENCTSLPQHNKSWTRSTTFDFTGENYNCSITLHLEPLHVVLLGQTV